MLVRLALSPLALLVPITNRMGGRSSTIEQESEKTRIMNPPYRYCKRCRITNMTGLDEKYKICATCASEIMPYVVMHR